MNKKADGCARFYALKLPSQTTFVMKVELNNDVDFDTLQKALDKALIQFDCFNVKLKEGFFTHEFVRNNSNHIIDNRSSLCFYVDFSKSNNYLFQVFYHKNIIHISFFHSLTDGNGAKRFTEHLINCYYDNSENINALPKISYENSYKKYKTGLSKKLGKNVNFDTEKYLSQPSTNTTLSTYTYMYNIKDILQLAKKYNATLTSFYSAVLAMNLDKENLPVSTLTLPVDLRRRFKSDTTRNFSTSVIIDVKNISKTTSINEATTITSKNLTEALSQDNLQNGLNFACTLEQLPYSAVPNFIKRKALKGDKYKNLVNLSNLGGIAPINENVKNIQFLLPPSNCLVASISMNSYADTLYINVSTCYPKENFDTLDTYIKTLFT